MFISWSRGRGIVGAGLFLGLFLVTWRAEALPWDKPTPTAPVVAPAPPPPPQWVRSELIFSLQRKDGTEVSQGEWESFIAEVVTPRFPEGLTMIEAFGKNKGEEGSYTREPINILVLVHLDNEKYAGALQGIASEYKKRFQLPVTRVNTPAEVKSY